MSQVLLTFPTSSTPLPLQTDWRAAYDQSTNQGDPKDLKSGCWRCLCVMAAPSTSSHFVENQAVPTFHSCSVCPCWCPCVNLKEFPDGLIEYLLRKNVFEGKHFFGDWRILQFFSLMLHSYPPQWLLDTLVFLSWSCPHGALTVSPTRAFVFVSPITNKMKRKFKKSSV